MESDTLKDYLGKMVRIEASEGRDMHPTYIGKVSKYDHDFVTLNPFKYGAWSDLQSIAKTLIEFEAGTTNLKKTINRRCIDSIEEIVLKE